MCGDLACLDLAPHVEADFAYMLFLPNGHSHSRPLGHREQCRIPLPAQDHQGARISPTGRPL